MALVMFCASRLVVISSISPVPNLVGSAGLQCAVYELAYEFGQKVQPGMSSQQRVALSDALARPGCSNATAAARRPRVAAGGGSREASARTPGTASNLAGRVDLPRPIRSAAAGAAEIFVATDGNDGAAGTQGAPLATLGAAQALARKSTGAGAPGATITLRGGTYHLGATLALTPLDSGLTLRSFAGELAELAGTRPVAAPPAWEAYKVAPGGAATMDLEPNVNVVERAAFGANNTAVSYAGKTPTAAACSAACAADDGCDAFTWHDADQPSGSVQWELMCYFVNRGQAYQPAPQTHHVSGVKSRQPPMNVWVARGAVPPASLGAPADGLRVNGKRAIRARWPNGDPEYQLFPAGWSADHAYKAPAARLHEPTGITVNLPNRSTEGYSCASSSGYCYYSTGVGGACAQFGYEPPSGYWCNADPPRGKTYTVAFPSGVSSAALGQRRWAHWKPNETVVNAFRSGHWFSYVWLVDQYSVAADNSSAALGWTVGGFQGGEGAGGSAEEFNVENVLDELDAPREWYLDRESGDLYYYPNATGGTEPPAPTDAFAVTQLEQLVTVTGAGTARGETGPHATGITLSGLKLTGAALTTLAPHGLPSDGGGDWAVARRAAVHLSGVEGVTVEHCLFERNDGNGVMISGYSRNSTVRGNEFHLMGENGIVSWGYTADFPGANRSVPIPATQGGDARDGNHPQGNLIESNYFHEIGHFQKQVSCYFQAQTQRSTLRNNICFNGPRAGFNFNDGMGGGNLLESNLIFNMVREVGLRR